MDPNGSGDGLGGWSLDDLRRYLTPQRYLPKNGGLFGSGWARYMADQQESANGPAPAPLVARRPQKPTVLPPWITPITPTDRSGSSAFSQPRWSGLAAPTPGRAVPDSFGADGAGIPAASPYPQFGGGSAPDPDVGPILDRGLSSSGDPSQITPVSWRSQPRNYVAAAAQPGRSPASQQATSSVSSPAASPTLPGSLSPLSASNGFISSLFGGPVPLVSPTGKVVGYYDHQAARAGLQITSGYAAIAPFFLPGSWMGDLLGEISPGATGAIDEAIEEAIEQHHPHPKHMGGAVDQELVPLRVSLHRAIHSQLRSAFKEAGFPPVGGRSGSTVKWGEYFAKHQGSREKAIEILRQVTADFDRANGTSISPKLEQALSRGAGANPPN